MYCPISTTGPRPNTCLFQNLLSILGCPLAQGPSRPQDLTLKPGREAGAETPLSAATNYSVHHQALSFLFLNPFTLSASPFCTVPALAQATCLSFLALYSSLPTLLPTSNLKSFTQQTKDLLKTQVCLNLSIASCGPWE